MPGRVVFEVLRGHHRVQPLLQIALVESGPGGQLVDGERSGVLHSLEQSEPVADEIHRTMHCARDVGHDLKRDLLGFFPVDLTRCCHRNCLLVRSVQHNSVFRRVGVRPAARAIRLRRSTGPTPKKWSAAQRAATRASSSFSPSPWSNSACACAAETRQCAVRSRTSSSEGITPLRYTMPTALRTPRSPATTRGRPSVRARTHSAVHTPIPRRATSSSITALSESVPKRSRLIWPCAIACATATIYSALRLVN